MFYLFYVQIIRTGTAGKFEYSTLPAFTSERDKWW